MTKSATTLGGKALCEWLSSTDLAVADTFQAVSCRGTWLHPHTKEWYELDYLLVDSDRLHQVQPRMQCVPGVADHRMKVLGIQLGSLTARASRKRRAQTWKSLSRPRDRTPKLCMEAFRGHSETAVAARKQFGLEVEAVLSSMEVPAPQSVMPMSPKPLQLKDGKSPTTPLLIFIQMAATLLLHHPPSKNVVRAFICGLRKKDTLLVDRFLQNAASFLICPTMLLNLTQF